MSKGFASSYRIVLLAVALFACFGVLGVRLVFLHVVEREQHLSLVAQVRRHMRVEKGRRGDILDDRGAKLATSVSRIVLAVDPSAVRPADLAKLPQLAALLDRPEEELRRIFLRKHRSDPAVAPGGGIRVNFEAGAAVPPPATTRGQNAALTLGIASAIAPALNPEPAGGDPSPRDAAEVATAARAADPADAEEEEEGSDLIQWAKLHDDLSESTATEVTKIGMRCLTMDRVYRRVYPNGELAAHIVGYVNRQQVPSAGIERYADLYLHAVDGWSVGEKDGKGREIARFRNREVAASDGYSVRLSIKSVVQDLIEQELAEIGRKYQPLKATIIVSDPRDGFILGLANYPTFDPNAYNKVPKSEEERMKNVAVADVYEPGSVFKIVAASGAIEEHLVNPHEVFDCTLERITYKGRSLDMPSEDHHMGDLTLAEIISHSSNKGAAQLGMRLGEERFYKYATAFGFGRTLGFPVGGEVRGIFANWKDWNPLDITRIPMGHSVAATVLQMHQAMSVIANDGVLMRPQIIREIRDADNDVVFKYDRAELNRVVSVETARKVAAMLQGVAMKGGTAPEAAIAGYEVAGKTGTTQKLVDEVRADGTVKKVYSNKHHIASFVGFFPASRPQVVISVIVDDADAHAPNGVAYGAKIAAPSFKNLGEKLIPLLAIKAPDSAVGRANTSTFASYQGGRR